MSESNKVAQAKLDKAIKFMNHAEDLVGDAVRELSQLINIGMEWEKTGTTYDVVQSQIRSLHRIVRANVDIDSDLKRKLGL